MTKDGRERMSAALFRATVEMLGLSQRDVARLLGVADRTVRSWVSGQEPVPYRVGEQVALWVRGTERLVASVAAGEGRLAVPRSDTELRDAASGAPPWPASWVRVAHARAYWQSGVARRQLGMGYWGDAPT